MGSATSRDMILLRITFFVLFLTTIGQAGIDIYLPSLPTMVHELGTTATAIQLSLTAYLIGFSFSQLIYGPLADRHGRRPILLIGLSIFLVGSILCVFATTTDIFFIARLIQGLGVGSASMMSRAISRDVFEGKQLAKVSAYVAMAWGVVPMAAPLMGSYIQAYLGWHYNFVLLSIIGAVSVILIAILLPETRPVHLDEQTGSPLVRYKYLLSTKVFLRYTLSVIVLSGVFVAFNMAGPFLLQNIFQQSVVAYGWWVVFVASGYLIGSYISSQLLDYWSSNQIIAIGLVGFLGVSSVMSAMAILAFESVYSVVIPMFLILTSLGLIYPQCISGSLSPFPKIAGSAGALFGFMVFLGGSITSFIMSHLHENNAIPLSIILVV